MVNKMMSQQLQSNNPTMKPAQNPSPSLNPSNPIPFKHKSKSTPEVIVRI